MSTVVSYKNDPSTTVRTSRSLLWVGIVSIVMFFAAFTSAYIVRKEMGGWLEFTLPTSFYMSTTLIILSSLSLWWAYRSTQKEAFQQIIYGLGATLALGLGFVFFQFQAYADLTAMGVYAAGSQSNAAGSFLYLITFLHLIHLLVGILVLIYTFFSSLKKKYTSQSSNGIYLCSMYWHFLTFLWIYLLLFLIYIR